MKFPRYLREKYVHYYYYYNFVTLTQNLCWFRNGCEEFDSILMIHSSKLQ